MPDLLLELFCEEIPASLQRPGCEQLKKMVTDGLVAEGLTYEAACIYFTPRRLVLDVRGISAMAHDLYTERKGPSVKAPLQAVEGFLRSAGLKDISQAEIVHDAKKGDFYVAKIVKKGRAAKEILADLLPKVIKNVSWPKSMRWGKDSAQADCLRWVRPLRNILCVFGCENEPTEIIDCNVGPLVANALTYGHRFLSDSQPIKVHRFEDYSEQLQNAYVVLDAERRKQMILQDAKNLAFANGLELVEDDKLLEEVAGLVEYPVVMLGHFEKDFLKIPSEIIQLTIRTHQKCFVLRQQGQKEGLSPSFILVSNLQGSDGGKAITLGNEKVVRARLSDALYFWQKDQEDLPNKDALQVSLIPNGETMPFGTLFDLQWEKPLDQRMAQLAALNVTFHAKLGSQALRVCRLLALVEPLAKFTKCDVALAKRAAVLAKADLQTQIVGEFPELQGVMGAKYAQLQGEENSVCRAIEEHYRPQGPKDQLPQDPVAISLALADKIDILTGFWLINEKPTGSKDPYGLRRAALGIIRIVLHEKLDIALLPLLEYSASFFEELASKPCGAEKAPLLAADPKALAKDLLSFIQERLKVYLREEGVRYDVIEAILTPDSDNLLAIANKMEALSAFVQDAAGSRFLTGAKRCANILAAAAPNKGGNKGVKDAKTLAQLQAQKPLDPALLQEKEEQVLFEKITKARKELALHAGDQDYDKKLLALTGLTDGIEQFFAHILVNDSNQSIRENRLALLRLLQETGSEVADFSKIVG